MSSPRCPTCYRRLYDGISQEIHDIVECTLAEIKPPSKSRPAKSRRQANTLEEAAWLGTTAARAIEETS